MLCQQQDTVYANVMEIVVDTHNVMRLTVTTRYAPTTR